MAQYALPDANLGSTNWTQGVGSGDDDGDWFDELDEGFGSGRGSGSGPDDLTTHWEAPDNPIDEVIATSLATVTDPVTSSGHIYRTRTKKDSGGGRQIDFTSNLLELGTVRATHFESAAASVWTTYATTLSGAEADAITNYANLEIETRAQQNGGGAPRSLDESAHEFECPDAGGGGGFAHSQAVIVE